MRTVVKVVKALGLLMVCGAAQAGTAPILLEACNLFDERDKRLECLRAANSLGSVSSPQTRQAPARAAMPNTLAGFDGAPAAPRSSVSASPSRSAPRSSGGATCYTGPRGGTYTITASGRKNYGGC